MAKKALKESLAREALKAARQAHKLKPKNEEAKELLQRAEIAYQRWMVSTKLRKTEIKFEGLAVTALAANGSTIAVAAGPSSIKPEGAAALYLVENGRKKLLVKNAHTGLISGLAFWRDKLISVSFDGTLRVWNASSGKSELIKKLGYRFWCLAVCDKYVIAGAQRGSVVLLEAGSWRTLASYKFDAQVRGLAFTSNSKAVLAAADEKVYRLSIPKLQIEAAGELQAKARAIMLLSNKTLAVGDSDGNVHILRQADLKSMWWKAHNSMIRAIQTAAGDSILACASMDGSISFWDITSVKEISRIKNAGWLIRDIIITMDAIYAASESSGLIKLQQ